LTLKLELAGKPDVVRVQKCHEVLLGVGDASVSRRTGSTVRALRDDDSACKLSQHLWRLVGRAIVNDDQLVSELELIQGRADRATQ
jgi:hypothetical protein